MTVLAAPLDRISREARPYPADALPEGGTGLLLFAAAYLGHNDAIHFARKEMTCTCVDVDAERLSQMHDLYPANWRFEHVDAWEFAECVLNRRRAMADEPDSWDVVSVDTFTGDATDRSLTTLDLWCSLARQLVTCTIRNDQEWQPPDGWRGSLFPRSTTVSWLVLRPC